LAKLTVEAAPVGVTWDRDLKGFGVRISPKGVRTYFVQKRLPGGKQVLVSVGRHGVLTAEQARTRARQMLGAIASGVDPAAERRLAKQIEQARKTLPTVVDLIARYEADYLPRKAARSHVEDRALARYVVAAFGTAKVAEVRHEQCDRLHREITRAGTPIRANRVAALGSKMWSLAIKWDWATHNPWHGIERNPETRRSRYLTPAEIQRLGAVLDAHENQQSANVVRLLLLTGARRGELLGATWSMFDLEAGVWTKPSSHTKQRKEHRIPLSAAALQILVAMKAGTTGLYLFPGAEGRHQGDLKKFWASVCKTAGIEGARIHDLRHTNASILASAGLSLPVIGAMLGHTQPQTTSRYAHLLDDPLRVAAEKVGAVVTGNGQSAEVVPLRRG
jgi:integrase